MRAEAMVGTDPLMTCYGQLLYSNQYEEKRLAKAWQLIANGQLAEKQEEYGANVDYCGCKDYELRCPEPCKHVMACRLQEMVDGRESDRA